MIAPRREPWIGPAIVASRARAETEAAERPRPFQWLVRAGFVARGITYGLIGVLALALAAGAGTFGTAPNQQGALELIDRSWPGRAGLVVIAAGLLAYALWKLTQGIFGGGPEGGGGTDTQGSRREHQWWCHLRRFLLRGGAGADGQCGPLHYGASAHGSGSSWLARRTSDRWQRRRNLAGGQSLSAL